MRRTHIICILLWVKSFRTPANNNAKDIAISRRFENIMHTAYVEVRTPEEESRESSRTTASEIDIIKIV